MRNREDKRNSEAIKASDGITHNIQTRWQVISPIGIDCFIAELPDLFLCLL